MIKTLSKAQKMEREKFRIPRSVQDAIPIRRIFADGIFQVGNQYSKTWSFTDINYAIAGKEDKTSMFLDYSELLNALDSGASAKITIYNRRINKAEFERSVLLPDRDDGLDEYRHEFNRMLTAQVTGTSNSIVRERYLTVSVVKRNADEARSYFARVGTDLVTHLAQLFSVAQELTLTERLHIFRDFFKAGEQAAAEFNIHEHSKRGQHFKDWFCPDSMEFAADHFKLDARYGRVLYLQDYASYIKDSFVSELCDLDRDLMLSIDILPVPTDEAARQLQSTLLGVETNVANWQRRQNANNNFTATVPYDMELQRKETKEIHIVIQARQVERLARQGELVLVAGGIPLVKRGGRDDAPLRRHAAAEHWLFADRLGAGVDHQAALPAGDAPGLQVGHYLAAVGDQHRRGGGRHHVAKAEILRPISAAAADILQNTPQVGILRFCELVTPAHGYPSSICSLSL